MSSGTWWGRVKTGSKAGFDKAWKAADKLGAPVNRLSNRLGSEAFWPTTLDKESDKAARILKSFCKDGFYQEEETQPENDGPKQKQRVLQKIPTKVIQNAKAVAIFTTMRTGLWMSGAGGSGVLVARLPDGSWSPPSGILLHTAGLGFMVGVDIYDCVVVINTDEALEAFTHVRCTLGGEISVAAGPVGAGGVLETELHKRQAPVYNYMKSRGFYAGVQIDGTVIIERTDENERFYGERIPVKEILAGKAQHPPHEIRRLMETLKAAQGDTDVDESIIPTEPPPGDYQLDDGHMFGVPEKDDPDPYGVLALEKEGLSLKEAGTHKRASWQEFSFNPAPNSPVHAAYRQSQSREMSRRSSWRTSALSTAEAKTTSSLRTSLDQPSKPTIRMSDMSTQTDFNDPPSPSRWSMRSGGSKAGSRRSSDQDRHSKMPELPEGKVLETSPDRNEQQTAPAVNGYSTPPHTPPPADSQKAEPSRPDEEQEDEDAHIEEPVVHSIQHVQPASPKMISKARIVNVPKRLPPKLPPRNPNRGSGPLVIDASPKTSSPEDDDEEASVKSGRDSNLASPPAHEEASATRHSSEKVDEVKQVDGQDDARRSRSESPSKMDDVKLDDDDDDEPEMSNPLAKAQEARKRESMPSGNEPATNGSQVEEEEEGAHKRESVPGGGEPAANASQVEEDKTHKRGSVPGGDEPAKNEPESEKQEAHHKRESMSGDDVQPSSQSQTEVEEVRKRESMPGGFE
ncbi:DUF500-domain-containing protein [Hortaea werneckii]|nr:DUF500-domain-containing protein [Hortaea werneckii]KAI7304826.1 DUF500-domain-containing protein [Hortaea werneckii]